MLPEQAEKLSIPAQERLRLNEGQRLFPGSDYPGEEYQQQSIRLPTNGLFDLSMQDDQLLAQQRIFRQQFSFAPGQIGKLIFRPIGEIAVAALEQSFLGERYGTCHQPQGDGNEQEKEHTCL